MEKEIRVFKIHSYNIDWRGTTSIEKLRDDLNVIEKLGATHVEIESFIDYDCADTEFNIISRRIETDEEFTLRINKENERKENIKRSDLELLEKLKAKYEQ